MQITVRARATATFPPERATVHLDLGHEGGDKQQVLALTRELARVFQEEIEHLRTLTPSPTTWAALLPISTRSWRPWSNEGVTLPMRHAAECRVLMKFRDFNALAGFIDRWGGREGVTVRHVEWDLTERRRVEEEERVLAAAVANARARATTIARAAGASSVEVLEIADPGFLDGRDVHDGPPVMEAAMRADLGAAEGVDLAPEDIELWAVVDARFTTR